MGNGPHMVDGVPRRCRLDLLTPAEQAVRVAVDVVERAGADPLLTDAVNLLNKAREKIADFVEANPLVLAGWLKTLKEHVVSPEFTIPVCDVCHIAFSSQRLEVCNTCAARAQTASG